jgi:gliding motility-associated-like protein
VTLIAASAFGCRDTVTEQVSVHNLPVVDFIFSNECFNDTNTFSDLSFITPGYISNWIWNFGDSIIFSGVPNTTHIYSLPGTYGVQLTAVSSYGCRDSIVKQVEVWELPIADFIPDPASGCKPLPVQFNDASATADGFINQWQWNLGDSTFSSEQNPQHIYLNDGIYSVWLMVTTNYGCIDTINYFNLIEVYPKPVAGFDYDPAQPSILHPMVYFYDQSIGANAWFYDFGDTLYSYEQHPIHSYENPGTYFVTQIVSNQYLCTDTATKLIEVLSDYTFWIPNTFTPNGDGKNDYFSGIGINIIKYELTIFNRWGDMIFESASMSNPWDGKVNGNHVQEGTYIFKIAYTDVLNQPHELLGHVNVVR